jgi:hypothetical protein
MGDLVRAARGHAEENQDVRGLGERALGEGDVVVVGDPERAAPRRACAP